MSTTSADLSFGKSKAFQAIFWAGLLCGVLDITAAFVNSGLRGVSPFRVLQAIASGLLGAEAYSGGAGTAVLGAVLHFVIAFSAAAVYFAASRKLNFLIKHAIISGLLYGAAVHLFMSFVVLPLSAFNKRPFSLSAFLTGLVIHLLFVGLPISLAVRRFAK